MLPFLFLIYEITLIVLFWGINLLSVLLFYKLNIYVIT